MNLMVMPVPILPGKTEQWQRFRDELRSKWFRDYSESRRRLGVRERAYFYSTPQYGDWVLVTLEGVRTRWAPSRALALATTSSPGGSSNK